MLIDSVVSELGGDNSKWIYIFCLHDLYFFISASKETQKICKITSNFIRVRSVFGLRWVILALFQLVLISTLISKQIHQIIVFENTTVPELFLELYSARSNQVRLETQFYEAPSSPTIASLDLPPRLCARLRAVRGFRSFRKELVGAVRLVGK